MRDANRQWLFILMLVVFCSAATLSAHATAYAELTLVSQPGDFIGQGGTYDFNYNSAAPETLALNALDPIAPSGNPSYLQFILNQNGMGNTFATVDFGTNGLGIPMQPGAYTDAQRAPFAAAGHPGLDISIQNRGCNVVSGSFTVTDATFGTGNVLESFAATYTESCEGTMPTFHGTFKYNANSPILPTPEPASAALLGMGFAMAGVARWRWRPLSKQPQR